MPKPTSPRDVLASVMHDGKQVVVPLLAEMLKREGIEEVDAREETRRFWQRALSPEQEQQLWLQEAVTRGITEYIPGSPQVLEIGLGIAKQVYPDRFDMMTGEGRDTESAQAEWAAKHARKGPPKPKDEQPAPAETMEEGY